MGEQESSAITRAFFLFTSQEQVFPAKEEENEGPLPFARRYPILARFFSPCFFNEHNEKVGHSGTASNEVGSRLSGEKEVSN